MVKSMSTLPCVICGESVEVTQPHFRIRRVSPEALESRHRVFALRPTHWSCYETWPARPRIAQDVVKTLMDGFEYRDAQILWSNRPVALIISPEEPDPDVALVIFAATGTLIEIPFSKWNPDRLLEGLGPSDLNDLRPIVDELRRHFPNGDSLTKGLPWEELKAKAEETRRSVEHDLAIMNGQWPEVKPDSAPDKLATVY